jgi:flagellar protein FliS
LLRNNLRDIIVNTTTAVKAYASVGIESGIQGASPIQLIVMLYQGAILAIANAKNGILRKDIPAKGKAISHAMRIIDEGLKGSLDKNVGGQIAQDLDALYDYMCLRLLKANLNSDIEALDEVARLLTELKSAWDVVCQPNASTLPVQQPIAMKKQQPLVYGRI